MICIPSPAHLRWSAELTPHVADEESINLANAIHSELQAQRPLVAIDISLQLMQRDTDEKARRRSLRLLCRAALIAQKVPLDDNDKTLDAAFNPQLAPSAKRFVAVCLLRAIGAQPDLFIEPSVRNRAFILFDAAIPDIYKECKIEPKSQTYQKEMVLRTYIQNAEREILDVFTPLEKLADDPILESINNARVDLGRILNRYNRLLYPFLPPACTGPFLEHLFVSVREYFEADDSVALHAYERATVALSDYSLKAEAYGTIYSRLLCLNLARLLSNTCAKKFDQSGAGKEAKLTLRSSEKRYPFHSPGRRVTLGFVLENQGPGYAREVSCRLETSSGLETQKPDLYLGNLGVGRIHVEFPVRIVASSSAADTIVTCSWKNFNDTSGQEVELFTLPGQPGEIDWDALAVAEPYRLEPVTTEQELVGRTEILNQLTAKAYGTSVGSACIWGQKRVGKTSISKTLRTRLATAKSPSFVVVFLEAGDYVDPDPIRTIERLGSKICRQVTASDQRLRHLTPPDFRGALSTLSDFFEDALAIAPDLRVIIILDEFDSVPLELYKRGPTGDAFFSTIRSLSHKGFIGFVLVGGERMRYVFDCQGQALNKFQMIKVDYFDRQKHWGDFQDLVSRPAKQWFQFADSALVELYSEAAGNPYYTVLLCRSLFTLMITRRDRHITQREAEEAVAAAVQDASSVNFQHFWDDGIIESGSQAERISMRRRYVLLALAEAMDKNRLAPRSAVADCAQKYNLDSRSIDNELDELIQRDVLIETDGAIGCKVPLFARWLRTVGPRQISTTFVEDEATRIEREREETASVRPQEIIELVRKWPPYKGRTITVDDARAWLEQFGKKKDQRLMFRVLQNVTMYSEDQVRNKMNVAHGIVARGLVDRREYKQVKRWPDVLVSYLDGPGKSGARFAKLYIDENGIYHENLVEKGRLREILRQRESVQAIIFLDDFVGTGQSVCEYLEEIFPGCEANLSEKLPKIFFVAVCGFQSGKLRIENFAESRMLPVKAHLCDVLDPSYVCFGEESCAFPDPVERLQAKEIARAKGMLLCKPAPLGFNDSQALVVFAHNCPNNTLPILWEKTKDWMPLFRRD